MNLIDTHCHLDFNKFDDDRPEVLERAARAGVVRTLIPALTLTSSQAVVKLAASHPMLYAAIGIHPTEADTWIETTRNDLRSLIIPSETSKIVAIGEIGLDYYWDTAPHPVQQEVLKKQLELAAELNLPVVIHLREKGDAPNGNCAEDAMRILDEWAASLRSEKSPLAERPGVLHSFSGSVETARQAIALNFYIGVTGPVTFKNAIARQQMISALPLQSLLIETDAPFLTPVPQRGSRNEPAFVRHIADKIAETHHCDVEEAAAVTTANAMRLFCWEKNF